VPTTKKEHRRSDRKGRDEFGGDDENESKRGGDRGTMGEQGRERRRGVAGGEGSRRPLLGQATAVDEQ